MEPATLAKLYDFARQGGRIFCIETVPCKSLGWNNHEQRDAEVQEWVKKLEAMPDNFIHLEKLADDNFMAWVSRDPEAVRPHPVGTDRKPRSVRNGQPLHA